MGIIAHYARIPGMHKGVWEYIRIRASTTGKRIPDMVRDMALLEAKATKNESLFNDLIRAYELSEPQTNNRTK